MSILLDPSFRSLMSILHDPSFRMTKLNFIIKHFQINVEKRFVNFYCHTISLCKAFKVLIFKYDVSEYRTYAIKIILSVPFLLRWNVFGKILLPKRNFEYGRV